MPPHPQSARTAPSRTSPPTPTQLKSLNRQAPRPEFVRPSRTLFLGPKSGLVAVLAEFAALGIAALKCAAPLSLAACAAQAAHYAAHGTLAGAASRPRVAKLLTALAAVEAVFFLARRTQLLVFMQRYEAPDRVPHLTLAERDALFRRCLAVVASPRFFVESWFDPVRAYETLKRGNLRELLSWAMFYTSTPDDALGAPELAQLEDMVRLVEERAGALEPGHDASARVLKFTDEPVVGQHRPLLMYAVTDTLFQSVLAPLAMSRAGYRRARATNGLVHWFRPGARGDLPPIVFIHGIGVGILPYQRWLRQLERLCDGGGLGEGEGAPGTALAGRGILVFEVDVISQRVLPVALTCDGFVEDAREALRSTGRFKRACFVGHSYGTFACSLLVKRAPELVASVGLIDPVCLLLFQPSVLYNICYHRAAANAVEYTLDFVMRAEVSLQHHLRRSFFWFRYCLFLEEINTRDVPTFVVVSDDDQLVPVHDVLDYVERYNAGRVVDVPGARALPSGHVELLHFQRADHAGFLFNLDHGHDILLALERVVARTDAARGESPPS